MNPKVLDQKAWQKKLGEARAQTPGAYHAMYSSWWEGIVTDPALMLLPIDEHMVHRGDGIFEAARVVDGAFFDLHEHLARLERSAEQLALPLPYSLSQISQICVATAKAAGLTQAALRLFVGRGPGSFSPNPYDSKRSHLYVVITEFKPLPESTYQSGVRALISKIPQKDPFYSKIKSCNYLPNVLMKKEAVDAGVDFSLGCAADGTLYEGPTENLALLSAQGILQIPKFDYTLRGTTLMCLVEFLQKRPGQVALIKGVEFIDLKIQDLLAAREAFMIGTTLEVLPLVQVNQKPIGDGRPGPVAVELRRNLQMLMREESSKRLQIR
ncbi:MAG: aminotransferase class IV [Bdellovibrionales bacterium]